MIKVLVSWVQTSRLKSGGSRTSCGVLSREGEDLWFTEFAAVQVEWKGERPGDRFWRQGCRLGGWGRYGREGRRKLRLGSGLVEGQCSLKKGRGVLRVLRD